ncbi:hypothetical protein [Desmospora activa]|uniref:Uncharacterized protein n=1 Tax=Desmospora activa DSM 45169 TaxID=1121389 RepID=A0A2T4YYY6_9BACL|nr:hypothetical protein [Desmospora activa]PTM51930.1 hypothetical protein C8J48_3754 [Desmospora activa DSM 45169]
MEKELLIKAINELVEIQDILNSSTRLDLRDIEQLNEKTDEVTRLINTVLRAEARN